LPSHYIRAFVLLVASTCGAWAGTISFSGTFLQDDDVQFFTYSALNGGNVTVATTSFDGTATGGFVPILSVFDSAGNYLFGDDGSSPLEHNATVIWNSDPGAQYIVTLTEWDNFPFGANLSEGFTEAGNGNFTANLPMNPGLPGGFYDGTGGIQRTGNWAVTFSADDGAGLTASVPEPGAGSLLMAGLALLAGGRLKGKFLRKGLEG
jgi:hypothetical protein